MEEATCGLTHSRKLVCKHRDLVVYYYAFEIFVCDCNYHKSLKMFVSRSSSTKCKA